MFLFPEEEKEFEKISEDIIVENSPIMGKKITTQVQEVQRVPFRINPMRNTPKYMLIKLTKTQYKEKILKAAQGKEKAKQKNQHTKEFT